MNFIVTLRITIPLISGGSGAEFCKRWSSKVSGDLEEGSVLGYEPKTSLIIMKQVSLALPIYIVPWIWYTLATLTAVSG